MNIILFNVHSKVLTFAVDFPNLSISNAAKVWEHGQSLRHEKGPYEEIPNEKSYNLKKIVVLTACRRLWALRS